VAAKANKAAVKVILIAKKKVNNEVAIAVVVAIVAIVVIAKKKVNDKVIVIVAIAAATVAKKFKNIKFN
jgi:hypothetical protein